WRNPYVIRVLKLMLPVTIALGLINFSLLINSFFGTLVNNQAPAAIDKAFRIYMLPQGIFSVAIATILFPTLSRFAARGDYVDLRNTMANGMRQICLTLIPSAAFMALCQALVLRGQLRGIDGRRTVDAILRMLVGAAALSLVAYAVWDALDTALGRALWAQCVSVGFAIAAGTAVYAAAVWVLRVPE